MRLALDTNVLIAAFAAGKLDVVVRAEELAEFRLVTDFAEERLPLGGEVGCPRRVTGDKQLPSRNVTDDNSLRAPVANLAVDGKRLFVKRPRLLHPPLSLVQPRQVAEDPALVGPVAHVARDSECFLVKRACPSHPPLVLLQDRQVAECHALSASVAYRASDGERLFEE